MSKNEPFKILEACIRAARSHGDFDKLPGRGKPLPPDDLAGLSSEHRFAARLMRTCGEVSAKAQLVHEIRTSRALIEGSDSPEYCERMERELHDKVEELERLLKEDS
jgi:hypothetical protein